MTETRVCGFCEGKPVGNAATWIDGKARPPAPCPRCGETNWPMSLTMADALALDPENPWLSALVNVEQEQAS